jgi:hypothetical protein
MKTPRMIAAVIAALTLLPSILFADLIRNGDFASQLVGWFLDKHSPAQATATFESSDMEGNTAIEIDVVEPGDEPWKVQLAQSGFSVYGGKIYTLTFYAKAEPELYGVVAAIAQSNDPYAVLASKGQLTLTPEWKKFDVELTPSADETKARLIFSNLGRNRGKIWLSQISLVENE